MSDSVRPHRWQPTRLPHPWDSQGKNTGVGCHFLLQRMKVKSESEVAQSCLTLSNPMDCSPPSSSIRGIFQARVLEWGAIAFSVPLSTFTYFYTQDFWNLFLNVSFSSSKQFFENRGHTFLFLFYFIINFSFLVMPCSMWNLSSSTRDWPHVPCIMDGQGRPTFPISIPSSIYHNLPSAIVFFTGHIYYLWCYLPGDTLGQSIGILY